MGKVVRGSCRLLLGRRRNCSEGPFWATLLNTILLYDERQLKEAGERKVLGVFTLHLRNQIDSGGPFAAAAFGGPPGAHGGGPYHASGLVVHQARHESKA